MLKNKTILITGGSGFIGSTLSESLIENNKIINIDNFNDFYNQDIKRDNIKKLIGFQNYILIENDIRNAEILDEIFELHKPDIVIHIAAMAGVRPSIKQPVLYEDVNIKGTLNILEAMKKHGVKNLIFASSSSVYGNDSKIPFKEDKPLGKVISPYAATKKSGEDFCYVYHHLYGLNVIALRFFTVYGPRQRPDLAIHKFTRMILNGEPIPFYGDGTTMRDYAYIDDIVRGINNSVEYVLSRENVFEIINLSGNKPVTLNEMVAQIEKATGKKAIINKLPMQPGDVIRTYADISKAQRFLNFQPNMPFEEGIQKFVDWYLDANK